LALLDTTFTDTRWLATGNNVPIGHDEPVCVITSFVVLGERIMKKSIATLTAVAVVLTCGWSYAVEQPGSNFEHLKAYAPLIGTWRYEGPLQEDVPDMGKKGTNIKIQVSLRWILNKSAIQESVSAQFQGGAKYEGKALIGWDSSKERIVRGGMNSLGGIGLGTVVFDGEGKTLTSTSQGVSGDGEKTSSTNVTTLTGKDTYTWQALRREGGLIEGPSAKYTYQRVKRARQRKGAKQVK